MRRAVCFLLAMLICLSVACPALAAAPSAGEDGPTVRPPFDWDNPKTGDIIMRWVLVMVIALAALIVLGVVYYKNFRK